MARSYSRMDVLLSSSSNKIINLSSGLWLHILCVQDTFSIQLEVTTLQKSRSASKIMYKPILHRTVSSRDVMNSPMQTSRELEHCEHLVKSHMGQLVRNRAPRARRASGRWSQPNHVGSSDNAWASPRLNMNSIEATAPSKENAESQKSRTTSHHPREASVHERQRQRKYHEAKRASDLEDPKSNGTSQNRRSSGSGGRAAQAERRPQRRTTKPRDIQSQLLNVIWHQNNRSQCFWHAELTRSRRSSAKNLAKKKKSSSSATK